MNLIMEFHFLQEFQRCLCARVNKAITKENNKDPQTIYHPESSS